MSSRRTASLAVAALALAVLPPCVGQVERGGISGSVVDPTGAAMVRVAVTATNQATGAVTKVETTGDGYYKIPYLAAGKYTLVMESAGFATNRVADIPVLVGQITTINATMKPGAVVEQVTSQPTPSLSNR